MTLESLILLAFGALALWANIEAAIWWHYMRAVHREPTGRHK